MVKEHWLNKIYRMVDRLYPFCEERDTYKYQLLEKGKVVYSGFTYDFSRRGVEHRRDFPSATIKQVGRRVTRKEALKWERRQSPNRMSYAKIAGTI